MHVVTSHMKKVSGCLICLFVVLILLSSCEFLEFLDSIVTVTYDSNGGTPVQSKTTRIGEYLERPSSPTRDEYIFNGWYLEKKKWDFDKDKIQEDMTLVARWIPDNPANRDKNAAWQSLEGTWTNNVYTVRFHKEKNYNGFFGSWSGYGQTGFALWYGPYYDNTRNVICLSVGNLLDDVVDIVFSKDSTTLENSYPKYDKYFVVWFPPGTWTKVESE